MHVKFVHLEQTPQENLNRLAKWLKLSFVGHACPIEVWKELNPDHDPVEYLELKLISELIIKNGGMFQ